MLHPDLFPLPHDRADNPLFMAINQTTTAPPQLISHLVASRTEGERAELHRILKHLPMVQEVGGQRHWQQLDSDAPSSSSRCGTPRPVTPLAGSTKARRGMAQTRKGEVAIGIRAVPDFSGRGHRFASNGIGALFSMPRASTPTPRAATPIAGRARAATPRAATPNLAGPQAGRSASQPPVPHRHMGVETSQLDQGLDSPIFPGVCRHDEVRQQREAEAEATATERVTEKLAELGIDPHGMRAGEILRLLYARGEGTAYWRMTREAQASLEKRVQTPRGFTDILNGRAVQEVRRGRDLPATDIHHCLDHWEIDFLADSCRSLKHFVEASHGPISEYTAKYQVGAPIGTYPRKKFVRRYV